MSVTFGLSEKADVKADSVESFPERGHRFRMGLFGDHLDVALPVPGRFNILNALAAAAGATLLGASPGAIQEGSRKIPSLSDATRNAYHGDRGHPDQ